MNDYHTLGNLTGASMDCSWSAPDRIRKGKTMYRNDVYDLVDGERDHQLKRHEKHEVQHRDEDHSVADWITYMEHHIGLAKLWVYHLNMDNALREVRKITALGVACMEYNETPPRESE